MNDQTYAALWPRGKSTAGVAALAPRLDTLERKTVAFLWDYLFRGDEIFPMLERELSAAYPNMKFVGYETFGSTHGADEARIVAGLPNTLTEHRVDAVVSAMGC